MTPAAASELHKIWVMSEVDDRTGASAGCAEVDGEVRVRLREAAEVEVSAAALRVLWAMCLAYDAACLPFGMVGELRRKLSPIVLLVLLLFMGVDLMDIRVSAVFPSLRQRAAFRRSRRARRGRHNLTPGSAGIGMYGMQPSAPADFIRRGFAARTNSRALDGLLVRF